MNANTFLLLASILALFVLAGCSSGGAGGDDDSGDNAADDDADDDSDDDTTDDTGDDDTSGNDDASDDDTAADDDHADDDTSGNLTWQDPPSSDYVTWDEANTYCENLNFEGHNDWRLPTISELRSLIRGCLDTETDGACTVTDDCLDLSCLNAPCSGCDSLAGPGPGGAYWPDGISGEIAWYWSSSAVADHLDYAWVVGFALGDVANCNISNVTHPARCVR